MGRKGERTGASGLLLALVACTVGGGRVAGEDPPPPSRAFEPSDISIGEPIAVPFSKPAERPRQQPAAAPGPTSVLAPTTAPLSAPQADLARPAASSAATAPNGWLGMAVAESRVPGRWSIVEIAPLGPAAAAGIAVGDDLASIDGIQLRNSDEVAQTLTAISAGQSVRLAVVRGEQVSEVAVVAVPRPAAAVVRESGREWQSAVAPAVTAPVPPARPQSPPAIAAAPRGRIALGVRTVPIDPEIRERFRLGGDAGAYVVGVVGDLPASRAGIPPGSVIVKMNDQPVRSPEELTRLVTTGPLDRPVPIEFVLPGGAGRRADVVLQSLEEPLERALVGDTGLQPTAVPALESGPTPRTSRMPVAPEVDELRREVGRLRGLLEAVERRLEGLSR